MTMNLPRKLPNNQTINQTETDTYKVKATAQDNNPDYLDGKVDNSTIQVQDNKVKVKFQDDKSENVIWSSQRVIKETIIKAIIFG